VYATSTSIVAIQNSVLGSDLSTINEAFNGFALNFKTNFVATGGQKNITLCQILEPLTDNGGRIETCAVVRGSLAIGNANLAKCLMTGETGIVRNELKNHKTLFCDSNAEWQKRYPTVQSF